MKPKMMIKMMVDLAMTILLLCLMAYMLVGETAHEWLGVAMLVLFIAHHALNWKWYRSLAKGKYTIPRAIQTVLNFLLLISMLGLMVSGIIMSREVFVFLPISGGMGFARLLHMLAAYWGFILMSLHLGLHWGMIMGMVRKAAKIKKDSSVRIWMLRLFAVLLCGFGVYAFIKNDIASYLFLQNRFVFFDLEQPLPLFFAEYIGMMGLWGCLAYYACRFFQRGKNQKKILYTKQQMVQTGENEKE